MPIPFIVAGGIGVAVGLIGSWVLRNQQLEREPSASRQPSDTGGARSTSRPADGTRRAPNKPDPASKPQCVKVALMVWYRASMQQAHELIDALTGNDAGKVLKDGRATEPQIRAIASLMWYRASMQQAHKLICALDDLQETPRPAPVQDLDELFLERRLRRTSPAPWSTSPAARPARSRRRPTSTTAARRPARVTFDDVRQAVQNQRGWNEDCDVDGRERWCGPCPIQDAPGCRVSAGAEHLGDRQEVLMACNACNPHDPGHLGRALFLEHLDALGVMSNGSRS